MKIQFIFLLIFIGCSATVKTSYSSQRNAGVITNTAKIHATDHLIIDVSTLLNIPPDIANIRLRHSGFRYDPDGGKVPIDAETMSTWYVNSRSTQLWIERKGAGKITGVGVQWDLDANFHYTPSEFQQVFRRVGLEVTRQPDTRYPACWVWHNARGIKLELMISDGEVWQLQMHRASK